MRSSSIAVAKKGSALSSKPPPPFVHAVLIWPSCFKMRSRPRCLRGWGGYDCESDLLRRGALGCSRTNSIVARNVEIVIRFGTTSISSPNVSAPVPSPICSLPQLPNLEFQIPCPHSPPAQNKNMRRAYSSGESVSAHLNLRWSYSMPERPIAARNVGRKTVSPSLQIDLSTL